jgi:hypothetical protein
MKLEKENLLTIFSAEVYERNFVEKYKQNYKEKFL